MTPSFVNPQGALSFYNGYTPTAMYVGNAGSNSRNVSYSTMCNTSGYNAGVPLAYYNVVIDQTWYIDSGATNHVTHNASILLSYSNYTNVEKLHIGNGLGLQIQHIGSAILNTLTTQNLYLTNILHVPDITKNLLSVSRQLANNSAIIEFHKSIYFVKDKNTGITLLKGIARDGLYQVEGLNTVCQSIQSHALLSSKSVSVVNSKFNPLSMFSQCIAANETPSFAVNTFQINKDAKMALFSHSLKSFYCNIMHKRLRHPTTHALTQVMKLFYQTFNLHKHVSIDFFSACQFGKSHKQHFPSVDTITTEPLEIIHADL